MVTQANQLKPIPEGSTDQQKKHIQTYVLVNRESTGNGIT